MTVKDLSQLWYLNREIEYDQKRLDAMRVRIEELEVQLDQMRGDASALSSPDFSGMPMSHSFESSKIERNVSKLCDLDTNLKSLRSVKKDITMTIHAKQILCLAEQNKLERYIAGIDDSLLRQIFSFRFINGLPWKEIAFLVSGKNTADSVKKQCYRYLKTTE